MSRTPRCRGGSAPSVDAWLQGCARHQPLAPRTVLELARRVQRWQRDNTGTSQPTCARTRRALRAREQLVRHNLRLICHTWQRHRSTLPLEAEGTADALQEAAVNLLRAAELFDPQRGYSFSTYASFWVRRGFSVHDRRQKRMIRLPADQVALVQRAQRLAAQQEAATGISPTLHWLAERCGPRGSAVPVADLRRMLQLWQDTQVAELDRPVALLEGSGATGGSGGTLLEQVADQRSSDPTGCAAAGLEAATWQEAADFPDAAALLHSCASDGEDEQRALLPVLLQQLNPQERLLLWHRYLREQPLNRRQLQRVMGLTAAAQEALETRALQTLRDGARAAGWSVPEPICNADPASRERNT